MPMAVEHLDLRGFDLVISSSSLVRKRRDRVAGKFARLLLPYAHAFPVAG